MKTAVYIIVFTVFFMALTWLFHGNGFFLYKVFAPAYEQTRRQVFEESKAYNQGIVQELENMEMEYLHSPPEGRAAMASIILHRASAYDLNRLPTDLKVFIAQLKDKESEIR